MHPHRAAALGLTRAPQAGLAAFGAGLTSGAAILRLIGPRQGATMVKTTIHPLEIPG